MVLRRALLFAAGQMITKQHGKALFPLGTCLIQASPWSPQKSYSTTQITKNLNLITRDQSKSDEERPLVVVLSWLLAKHKHLMKYANFYMGRGFDVLTVNITPWQLLWPVKGTQLIAADLLQFLHSQNVYYPLLLHGFSVGGYVWGETLVRINSDLDRYKPVTERIIGQIWDSAADITEIPTGFSRAVFPKNLVLQKTTEKYLRYHLRTFHDVATQHYIRASQLFHASPVRCPALFLLSKTDPIGTEVNNRRVQEGWNALAMKTYMKCWDKSPHVGHFRKHPEEYIGELKAFLDRLEPVAQLKKMQAKL